MITTIKTQALQLGSNYQLPVHILYRSIPGRLGGDLSFADAIIAKYKSADDQELPSADFAYPKFGERDAGEALTELSRQFILMNRIRIQMNIRNYRIMQRYSLTVSARCDQLLNMLLMRTNIYSGVSQASVRELMQIHRELRKKIDESAGRDVPVNLPSVTPYVQEENESELIVRILTAASRGNGTRERYMRQLMSRIQSLGITENRNSYTSITRTLLRKAEAELFRLPERETGSSMTIWMSEAAKQFFWRIQRTPEPLRSIFLRAGGFSSLVSFEKVLKSMSTESFREFAEPFMQRISASLSEPVRTTGRGSTGEEYGDEEWLRLYHVTENATAALETSSRGRDVQSAGNGIGVPGNRGLDGTAGSNGLKGFDGIAGPDGKSGFDGSAGQDGVFGADGFAEPDSLGDTEGIFRVFEQMSDEEWETFRSDMIYANREGILEKQAPELYRALTEDNRSASRVSPGEGSEESGISGAAERSGNRAIVENYFRTMDRETFHTVIGPIMQRITGQVSSAGISEEPGHFSGNSEEMEQFIRYTSVEQVFAILADKAGEAGTYVETGGRSGQQSTEGLDGRDGLRGVGGQSGQQGTEGLDGRDGQQGTEGVVGRDGLQGLGGQTGLQGAEGVGGQSGQQGTEGVGGRDGLQGVGGRDGLQGLGRQTGLQGAEGVGGQSGQQGAEGVGGRDGLHGLDGETGLPGAEGFGVLVGEPETTEINTLREYESLSQYTSELFEIQSEEVWEQFCSEMIYADQEGELKKQIPELYEALNEGKSRSQAGTATGSIASKSSEERAYIQSILKTMDRETLHSVVRPVLQRIVGNTSVYGTTEDLNSTVGEPGINDQYVRYNTVERVFAALSERIGENERVNSTAGTVGTRGIAGSVGQAGVQGTVGQAGRDGTVQPGAAGQAGRDGIGQSGAVGQAGRDGIGQQGVAGLSGTDGIGQQGVAGLSGRDGIGQQGVAGLSGSDGIGQQGIGGLSGSDGIGQQGIAGLSGSDGIGQQGVAGLSGTDGIGQQGVAGLSGTDGIGQQGVAGLSGRDGIGQQGIAGLSSQDGLRGTSGLTGQEGFRDTEDHDGRAGLDGAGDIIGRDDLHGVTELSELKIQENLSVYTDYLFENQSDEVWELFCSELIYSDQNGELKKRAPELYQALTEALDRSRTKGMRIESATEESRNVSENIETSVSSISEKLSSRTEVEKILGTMDQETFHTVVRPLLLKMSGDVLETERTEATGSDYYSERQAHENTVYSEQQAHENTIYLERFFENLPEEIWTQFCSEMLYADHDGILIKQAPELYKALVEGKTGSEIADSENIGSDIVLLDSGSSGSDIIRLDPGSTKSRAIVGHIFRTMDHETYRTVVQPLLIHIAGISSEFGLPGTGIDSTGEYHDTDRIFRDQTMERVFTVLAERTGSVQKKDEFVDYISQFFEQHTDEDWEMFKSELIYADRNGDLKEQIPELYQAFTEMNADVSGQESGRISAGASGESETGSERDGDAIGYSGNPEQNDSGNQAVEILREKELLYRILREERGTLRILRTLIIEAIRNIAIIRENQKEFMTLAESIMNLSSEQWSEFKQDVRILHKEDLDIRELIPETILQETISKAAFRSLEKNVRQTEEHLTQQEIVQEGIRMSSEKMELLRVLQKETRRHDTVFTETGRKLFLNTVLRESDAGRLIRPSFRELSSEGRESWRNFVTDLMHIERQGSGRGTAAGAVYFGRLADQYGLSGGDTGVGRERISAQERAIQTLELRRKERILNSEDITERWLEAERIKNTETQVFRLLATRPGVIYSDDTEDSPQPALADMAVPRPVLSRETAERIQNAEAALRNAGRQQRTESSHDIEFETIRHTVTEQGDNRDLKAVSETLERHEREIAEILKSQKADRERDLPREVIKQINDRLRMERLRSGR